MTNKSLNLPEYFVKTGDQVPDGNGFISGNDIYSYSNVCTNALAVCCVVKPDIAMPFGDTKQLIREIRENLLDNEGIIEVTSGKNDFNQPYVYRITKRNKRSEDGIPLGVSYMLGLNLKIDGKIWYVDAVFEEAGDTGIRSAFVAAGLYKKITGKSPFDPDGGWVEDPYDKSYTKGVPMIYAEREEFDSMFPEDPLSELRRFLRFVLDNNKGGAKGMAVDLKKLGSQIDINALKEKAKDGLSTIDVDALKEKAVAVGDTIGEKAVEVKDSAIQTKDDLEAKLTELDRVLQQSINEYNDAYTLMNDKGVQLYVERWRAADSITNIQNLINSIANHPKSFDTDFEEINSDRAKFIDSCEFADKELKAAREAAGGAGAGLAAGTAVAFLAPTAAMWIATTFGTASTGVAISTLSGAAATNAALAWLGGGALAAGGGGMGAGTAFLALAGPIGWTIAGATLLTSILLFASKKTKLNKQKNEEIESVKQNIELIKEMDAKINALLTNTIDVRNGINQQYTTALNMYGKDYTSFNDEQKSLLGSLVNNTKALSALFGKTIE